jgi:membrane associated rhomboid family serine protease
MHFVGIRVGCGAGSLTLDACDECRIVWFDGGEHEAARGLRDPPPPKESDLVRPSVILHSSPATVEAVEFPQSFAFRGDARDIPAFLGLPAEEDAVTVGRPVVIVLVAVAMVAATTYALWSDTNWILRTRGLDPGSPFRHGGLDFVTSFLLHVDFWHLLSNIYFLFLCGDDIEDQLGHARTLGLLAAATVAGDLLYLLVAGGSGPPTVGASGGIAGLLAFYAIVHPRRRLRLVFWAMMAPFPVTITARWAFGAWLLLQVWGILTSGGAAGEVNHLAHLGGAVAGLAFAKAIRRGWTDGAATTPGGGEPRPPA